MDFLSPIVTFVTDTRRKLTHRVVFILSCIVILFLLNDLFGFSYYYNSSRKVEQISEINTLLKDSLLDVPAKKYLQELRHHTIQRENIFTKTVNFLVTRRSSKRIDTVYVTIQDGKKTFSQNKEFKAPERSRGWHFVTANLFWMILALALPFIPGIIEKSNLLGSVFAVFFAEIFLVGFMLVWSYLLNLIPIIFGKPIFNYFLNAGINVLIVLTIVWLHDISNKHSKKKA